MDTATASLHHAKLTAPGARPDRWILFLHGLLGTGANWRTFARRWVETEPEWGAVTVDLRMHGQSQGFASPHTLDACAVDVAALGIRFDAVLGHSLGGKVALAFAARRPGGLSRILVLDSDPGPAEGSQLTLTVLEALASTAFPFPTLKAFWDAMQAKGISLPVAQWLGMNLAREADGYRLAVDLEAMRALLDDYRRTDFWPVVESAPDGLHLDFLLGGRSSTGLAIGPRLEALAARHSAVSVEVIPGAGHWVHVDAPGETFRFVRRAVRS